MFGESIHDPVVHQILNLSWQLLLGISTFTGVGAYHGTTEDLCRHGAAKKGLVSA